MAETFKAEDDRLRAAMARFNPGGLANVPDLGFLFVYPDKYYIYFYDYDFTLKKSLNPGIFLSFILKQTAFPRILILEIQPMSIVTGGINFFTPVIYIFLKINSFWLFCGKRKGDLEKII